MNDFTISLTPIWFCTLIAVVVFFLVASGGLVAYFVQKYVNKMRNMNYGPFAEKKSQERIATLEAQCRLDAKIITDKGRQIIDLETRNRAAQHFAKQAELALTPGIDITGAGEK